MAVLVAMPVAVTANAVTPANPYAGQQTRPDRVLEVGFGPGVIIHRLSKLAAAGHVAGIDQSREMVEQARARNATGIQSGRVDLRHGSVKSLPFDYNSFDRAACDQLDASLAGRGGWIAGNTASHEIWRPDRAWLYALFRAAEQRIDGNTHRRWLREGARGGDIQGILYAGEETIREQQRPPLRSFFPGRSRIAALPDTARAFLEQLWTAAESAGRSFSYNSGPHGVVMIDHRFAATIPVRAVECR